MDLYIIQAEDSRLGLIPRHAEGHEGMFYQPCSVKGNKTQNFSFFFSNLTLNKKHFFISTSILWFKSL